MQQYFFSKGFDPHVCQCFVNHKITGPILLELDLAYLKEIDITSFGTRFEISKEIKQLNQLVRSSTISQASNNDVYKSNDNIPPPTPVSNTNSMIRTSVSSVSHLQNTLMSPPQFKRQSVLRTAKDNTLLNNYLANTPASPPYQQSTNQQPEHRNSNSHKKDPSFDRNWVHPATLKKQEQERQDSTTNSQTRFGGSGTSGSVKTKLRTPQTQKGRVRSSTISTADQYLYDNKGSPDRPAMPSIIPFSQFAVPKKQSYAEATPRQLAHSRQDSKDTIRVSDTPGPYTATKHTRSTSSLGLSEFKFLNAIDAPPEGTTSLIRRRSSSFSGTNPAPVPEKDNLVSPNPPLPEKDFVISSGNSADEKPTEGDGTLSTSLSPASPDGRPKRSSTSAGNKKKKPPTLRSSSSHSNLKSKNAYSSKQKTSAFQEGINAVSPTEAAKTASFSGWMNKRGSVSVGTWKSRFFCLHGTRLSYFSSFNDVRERGLIDVTSHRVVSVGESDDKFVALYAASVGAGRYCFKVVPPLPGTRKGVTFTMPKVHYFAVDSREEMRAWMAALMKATIDRDDTVPVISSCVTPTVPLVKAQELFAEARAKEEFNRAKAMAAEAGIFGGQINSSWLNGFGQYDNGTVSTPDSPSASSLKSAETGSTNITGSSLAKGSSAVKLSSEDYFNQPPGLTGTTSSASSPDLRHHLTTKTAGLRVVTDLSNSSS